MRHWVAIGSLQRGAFAREYIGEMEQALCEEAACREGDYSARQVRTLRHARVQWVGGA